MRRARTPHEIGFDRYDRRRLARALQRVTDLRLFRRLQAILLVARGWVVSEVALITGAKPDAIYAWVRLYLETHRPDSLRDAPRPGRPRAARRITDARIIREFRRDPLRLGYNSTGWTVALLAQHLGRK
jgi:transposase